MHKVFFLFCLLSFPSNAQLNIVGPIDYAGYDESVRTVHFSNDGTKLIGDWDDVVEWDISSQTVIKTTEIPGYSTYKSSYDGTRWINGNSNYNTEAEDIADMHNNFNVLDSSGMTATKVVRPYGLTAIIEGSTDAVVLASTEKHTYQVVRLNLETMKESTIYFDENRDGVAVPTAIKVSDDGKYVGVSFAGENAGVRIYDLETGALLKHRKSDEDSNDLAFSSDGMYVFVNDGKALVQINTKYWREVRIYDMTRTITSLDVNSDGTYAVFSYEKKGAALLNVQTGVVEATLGSNTYWDVTYSDNDELIALGVSKRLKKKGIASIVVYQILK